MLLEAHMEKFLILVELNLKMRLSMDFMEDRINDSLSLEMDLIQLSDAFKIMKLLRQIQKDKLIPNHLTTLQMKNGESKRSVAL